MLKKNYPLILIVLFLLPLVNVSAQTEPATDGEIDTISTSANESSPNETASSRNQNRLERQAVTNEREETRTELRETRQENMIERREALTEVRQQRVINLAANLSNRLEAAVARLFQIVERLESRLSKLEASGINISDARSSLRRASAHLTEARDLMRNIDKEVNSATTSNTPSLAWQNVHERYTAVTEKIRLAHRELRQTISDTKAALSNQDNSPNVSEAVRADISNE